MEKLVKGATKIKLAAPKSKYVEPILAATRGGESGIADIFRTLQLRLRDTTWTIVFKGLIVVHLMIREGAPETTLRYIAESPKRMAISSFTEGQIQGVGIRRYYEYLLTRVKVYRDAKVDHVRSGSGILKESSVDKGLLRQTELVQEQIKALLKCDLLGGQDPENEISITAFRLLTLDLLELFKVMNEGTINVLEHYFEMSKPDAQRALSIYKTFGRQTEQVVQYLSVAREYELYTKLTVPKLKHAPTTLTGSLQEYVNDPDFEINRRQYLAQQQAKKSNKSGPATSATISTDTNAMNPPDKSSVPYTPKASAGARASTGPAPDLIDFFESIEQNQQVMAHDPGAIQQQQQQQQQQFVTGFASPQAQLPQQTGYNPFQQQSVQPQPQIYQYPQPSQQQQPLQPDFTGAGFGGYGPQPTQPTINYGFAPTLSTIPQDGLANFQGYQQQGFAQPQQSLHGLQPQQTSTNPFRQSMMPPVQQQTNNGALHRQSTNPFAKHAPDAASASTDSPVGFPSQEQPAPLSAPPLQPQVTGTNPFAKARSAVPANTLPVHVTGSTNPFRQSQFVNQATGQGWQHSTQGTFSGFNMNNVDTVPVFPRPGQP